MKELGNLSKNIRIILLISANILEDFGEELKNIIHTLKRSIS